MSTKEFPEVRKTGEDVGKVQGEKEEQIKKEIPIVKKEQIPSDEQIAKEIKIEKEILKKEVQILSDGEVSNETQIVKDVQLEKEIPKKQNEIQIKTEEKVPKDEQSEKEISKKIVQIPSDGQVPVDKQIEKEIPKIEVEVPPRKVSDRTALEKEQEVEVEVLHELKSLPGMKFLDKLEKDKSKGTEQQEGELKLKKDILTDDIYRTMSHEVKTIMFCQEGAELAPKFEQYARQKSKTQKEKNLSTIRFEGIYVILRQPFKILTDIWGVLTPYTFRQTLFDYIDDNIENYLSLNLQKPLVQGYIEELFKRNQEDLFQYPDLPHLILNEDDQAKIKSIVNNLKYRRDYKNDRNLFRGLDSLYNQIWNEGYSSKKLRPVVFPDVIPNFRKWASDPYFVKIYSFASGPLEIQKLFLSASTEGNVSEWITSGFDTHHFTRFKYDIHKYRGVITSLQEREAKNLFYMTDSPRKGQAARQTGMTVFIVLRNGNRKYKPELLKKFITINNFDELQFIQFDAPCC